jgi:outer membrane protein insertion porin family
MKALILLLMLGLIVEAQTTRPRRPVTRPTPPVEAPRPAAASWLLDSVVVKGAKIHPGEKILAVAGLKAGQMAGKSEFEAGRDRLLATGYFETVGYKFEPVAGKPEITGWFEVVEVTEVYPWRLEDLPITNEEFLSALMVAEPLAGPRLPGTAAVLKRCVAVLQKALADKNVKTPVKVVVTPEDGKELLIAFRADVPLQNVALVDFKGNKAIQSGDLTRAIANTAIGSPFTEIRFRQYLAHVVTPMYEAIGRLRATFPKINVTPAKDVRGVAVVVEVNEGEVYKLGEVEVTGAPLTGKQIQKTGGFKGGEPANFKEIEAGVEAILQELKNVGYLKPTYKLERKISDAEKTVDVGVAILPGEQYKFGKLDIVGLDIETEPVIRKMWGLKAGEPYNESYPRMFLQQVRAGGIFDNLGETRQTPKVDDARRVVDVVLTFKGAGK